MACPKELKIGFVLVFVVVILAPLNPTTYLYFSYNDIHSEVAVVFYTTAPPDFGSFQSQGGNVGV